MAAVSKRGEIHLEGWHKKCSICLAENSLAVPACRSCGVSFDQTEAELNYEAHFQLLRDEAKKSIRFLHEANKLILKRSLDRPTFEVNWSFEGGLPDMKELRSLKRTAEQLSLIHISEPTRRP